MSIIIIICLILKWLKDKEEEEKKVFRKIKINFSTKSFYFHIRKIFQKKILKMATHRPFEIQKLPLFFSLSNFCSAFVLKKV